MHFRQVLHVALAVALAGSSLAGAAERVIVPGRAVSGEARFTAAVERGEGSAFTIPLRIDVSRVARDGQPIVLGAYVARIDFDPAAVEYLGAKGGAAEQFAQAPIATDPAQAKAAGTLKVVGYHASPDAPAGVVHVATLSFTEKKPAGSETVKVTIESLASALRPGLDAKDLAIPLARRESPEGRVPTKKP